MAGEVDELYARRWCGSRGKTLSRDVKVQGAPVGRSRLRGGTQPDLRGIHNEIAARMVALNVVRTIILEATNEHDVDPLRISLAHATRAILVFAPVLASQPVCQVPRICRGMLAEIAAHIVPERPGRTKPHAVRHEQKHHPRLRQTRREWRLDHAA